MKSIEINGKEFELNFGIGFVNQLDEMYKSSGNGIELGTGLQYAVIYLKDYNPAQLANMLVAATRFAKGQKPTTEAIENWLVEKGENDELEAVFDAFLEKLKTSGLTKLKVAKVLDMLAQAGA